MGEVPMPIVIVEVYVGLLVVSAIVGGVIGARRKLTRQNQIAPYCPRCRYDLRGREDTRCPECGLHPTLGELWVAQLDLSAAADVMGEVHDGRR